MRKMFFIFLKRDRTVIDYIYSKNKQLKFLVFDYDLRKKTSTQNINNYF